MKNIGTITSIKEIKCELKIFKTICIRLKNTIKIDVNGKDVEYNVYADENKHLESISFDEEIEINEQFDILMNKECAFELEKKEEKWEVKSLKYYE